MSEFADYDETTDESTVSNPADVATLITEGLEALSELKEVLTDADSELLDAKQSADEAVREARGSGKERFAQIREEADAQIRRIKEDADARLAEVKESVNQTVASVTAEHDNNIASAEERVEQARENYTAKINELIGSGWATTGSLASLGHKAPGRKGGRRRK